MEGIFTLPYSEYEAINQIKKYFTNKEGYNICIPVSRQQKGYDFIIINEKNNRFLKIQVKSSRTYSLTDYKKSNYEYAMWFNNFYDRYEEKDADYYLLFGLYPNYSQSTSINSKYSHWKSTILIFKNKDMFKLLKKVKTKKEKKPDRFFGLVFNNPNQIFTERGFDKKYDFSEYALKKQIDNLKRDLK